MLVSSQLCQLEVLCRTHNTAPKVVFVPRVQLGRAIETALARRACGWAGLSCTIPLHYAQRIARWDIAVSGRSELPPAGLQFVAANLIEEVDDALLKDLPAPHYFARTVSRSIDILRRSGATPEHVRSSAQEPGRPAALRVVAACYEGYHDYLEGNALYDDADVMRWARLRVAEKQQPLEVERTVYAVFDEVELTERSYRFIQALREHGRAFYRIGEGAADEAPPGSAAAFFAGAPLPKAMEEHPAEPRVRVRRAVGAENEVRGTFYEILRDELPLDEVEIACAATEPYVSLAADVAEQLGVEVSLGTGLPALQTKTGQALCSFYEWIREGFAAKILVRLLRSGLVRIDRELARKNAADAVAAHEVATLLAGRRYEPGRRGWQKAFAVAAEDLEKTIRAFEGRDVEADRERKKLRTLALVQEVVDALLELVPQRATVQEFARTSQRFLERFGPIDPVRMEEETKRTVEEAARNVIYQKLERLGQLPVTYEAPSTRLATLFKEVVERQYVRSEHPRAGAAHVLPLESAGYAGRKYVFVLGMDSGTLTGPALENVILPDADRTDFAAGLDGSLQGSQDDADAMLWRVERALRRHRGVLTLYANVFDLESGEERFPSAPFLELEGGHPEKTPLVGLLPDDDGVQIDERACWLNALAKGKQAVGPCDRSAREVLKERYPWVLAGEAAREARASHLFTCHDGLLKSGPYPELDFTDADATGAPMSAGRLETLAETPYLYFLKYVLGVEPLDEPALEEGVWLDPLRRGGLLHRTFEQFVKGLDGQPVAMAHEDELLACLDTNIAAEKRRNPPPNERVEGAVRRRLQNDVLVFLQAEAEAAAAPLYVELGFGYGRRYERKDDLGAVSLTLPAGKRLSLRGRIDRVDEAESATFAIWDYKTGSAKGYSEDDPLGKGATLQWALYAYVLSELTGGTVRKSGYYFATAKEMGMRFSMEPGPFRKEVEKIVLQLAAMARGGCFPMTPKARDTAGWKWGGYGRLFPDLAARSRQLKAKEAGYPEDRPRPLFL